MGDTPLKRYSLFHYTVGRVLNAWFNNCERGISDYIANLINAFWCARASHTPQSMYGWALPWVQSIERMGYKSLLTVLSPISCVTLNFLTAAALPFSLAYFPMRTRSSGVNDVVYLRLLARLPPFSFDCKAALTAWFTSWSTLGDSCVWLAVGRVVAGWKYRRRLMVLKRTNDRQYCTKCCTYHVTNVLHFNLTTSIYCVSLFLRIN